MLSKVVGANVNTYENPSMDCMIDIMEQDLDDCKTELKKLWWWVFKCLKVKNYYWDDKDLYIELDNIECNDNLDFDKFKIDLAKAMQDGIEKDIITFCWFDLQCMFANYGMKYNGMNFYTPKTYNFESDSLDIRLKLVDDNWSLEKYKLTELVQEYIDTQRKESCDWYMSFEPRKIDEMERDDYAVLRAILKKEWVMDYIKESIDWIMWEEIQEIVLNNCNAYYQIRVEWKIDWDTKYNLDYDNKILVKID